MASRQAGMAMPPPGAGPGSMPPSRQQHQPPPGPSAPSGPPGSLPPGTLVQVGPYTVSVKRYLSQGGFATVYLVNSDRPLPIPTLGGGVRNETLHVLKRIVVPDKEALADVRREVDVHKLLRSDAAVVHFLEASALCLPPPQTGYDVYILMEYCSGGGLLDLLNARLRNRLTEHEVLTIFLDIAKGVAAMHHLDPPVAHRDLKIENILISSEGGKPTYKLCDFGSAKPILSRRAPRSIEELKRLEQDLNKSTTLPYRPPEMVDVYQRRVIDEKADIWALGVLLYKLCYYTTPFEENGGGPLAILNVKYRFPSSPPYGDKVKGLIASLLVDPSHRRPGIDQLIVMVHKALGTKPDPKTLHYAQQAAAGQQIQPLPTVAPSSSSSSSSSAPRALDDEVLIKIASSQRASHNDLAGSGSHDLPSGRSRPASMAIRSSSQRQRPDLISFEPPTAKAASKADETQRLMKLEGIEPMRRGRPGAGNKEEAKAKAGLQPPSGVLGKLQAPPQPRSGSTSPQPPPSATSPTPPSAAAMSGFGDSFEPPPATADEKAVAAATQPISPPPASATRQGPVSLGSVDVADSAAKQQQQSRAPPPAKEGEGDTSAEGRYPSLEELDRRYPEAKAAAASRPSQTSGGAAASGVVASMANRFRTGEAGQPSSPSASAASPSSSPSSSSRPTPALPPRKPSGWASNSGSLGRSSTIGSIGSRSQDATSAQPSVKPGSIKDKPVPPPPSAADKPTPSAPTNGHAKPAESDDEEEEEGPEEAGASGSVRRRWAQYSRDSAPPDDFGVRQSAAPPGRVGKVAAPGWLEDAKKNDKVEEGRRERQQPERKQSDALPPKAPPKPLIDFSAPQGAAAPTASSAKSPPPTSSPSLPTTSAAAAPASSATSTTAASRAPAWAWDGEDEEEVRDWKLAPPIGSPSKELPVGSPSKALLSPMAGSKLDDGGKRDAGLEEDQGKLVDLLAPEPVETQPTTTTSLSPRPTAVEAPRIPSPSMASARPPSPAKLIPSRARLQEGSRAYRDAATSPAQTALPSPAPSPAPVPNGSPSTATSPVTPGGTSTVAGHPAYAKGTASNLASRWEKMGGAIQSQAPYRGVPQRNGTLPASSSSAAPGSMGKGRAETLAAPIALPGLAKSPPPPPPAAGQSKAAAATAAASSSSSSASTTAHLKPWEREELERHEALARFVHAGRSDASPSPPPAAPSLSPPAARNPRLGGIGAVDITKSASASSSPTPTPGSGESPEQQAAARYKSVASLIDRWQANAGGDKEQQGNVPVQHRGGRVGMEKGWGEIGSRAGGAAAARERLPGRDV